MDDHDRSTVESAAVRIVELRRKLRNIRSAIASLAGEVMDVGKLYPRDLTFFVGDFHRTLEGLDITVKRVDALAIKLGLTKTQDDNTVRTRFDIL